MRPLQPFAVDPGDLPSYVAAVRAALDGSGPALAPYAYDAPPPPVPARSPAGTALVLGTSGSTGEAKRAVLTAAALTASADATHARLGGPGRWLLPMPAHHVAGTQVIVRSIRAGTEPVLLDRFDIDEFVAASLALEGERLYTSVVPTQLRRLIDHGHGRVLARYDGVLVGGAASPPSLLAEARGLGIPVVTTYGMTETCGGCVYDGRPLDGVLMRLTDDGAIELGGPTIASGYLDDPTRTAASFTDGWFRTGDLGRIEDGVLSVFGRADDLINTGGLKVAPRVVEDAATSLPQIKEAVVVGRPDDEWGQAVSLAVVAEGRVDPHAVREALRPLLSRAALPRTLIQLDALPLRGPGKPDRAAIAAMPGWVSMTD